MGTAPTDLVLELLHPIRGDTAHIRGDVIEIKERLGLLEAGYASLTRCVDRIGGNGERIKVRLELLDAPAEQ